MSQGMPTDARGIAYYVLLAVAIALLIVDLVGDGPEWANAGVIVLVVIAAFLRPGGLFKNRS